jgi:DNA mismatch repair protein MutL
VALVPQIHVLPRHLVNRIAAGEVIERPASVVKELAENSLDAAATLVDIAVEDGGRRLIAVRDSGLGMDAEDLALAFVPHATSKIAGEEDLFGIVTLGFRGEALASVASVAHASILSRRRGSGEEDANEIRAEEDSIGPVRPARSPEGTTVTVRDLFYNTPARRKFLRTPDTEFGHIVEQVARLALPKTQVEFRLTHNGRLVYHLPAAQDLRQRVADLYGAELAGDLIEFSGQDAGIKVHGLLGPPAAARATARLQHFFVNGRYVRDRFLAHALREAYRGMVEPGRSPVALVFVEVEPGEVDVNVHPTKVEVRFRNGQAVHAQVLGEVREALNRGQAARAFEVPPAGDADLDHQERRQSLKQALADFFKSHPPPQQRLDFPTPRAAWHASGPPAGTGLAAEMSPPAQASESVAPGSPPATEIGPGPAASEAGRTVPAPPTAAAATWQPAARTGAEDVQQPPYPAQAIQIHDSYIVTATQDGLAIIDQHALHERIVFQDLLKRMADGNLASQRLLIPATVEATESDKAMLSDRAGLLSKIGLEVTEFGPRTLAVQRFPSLLVERKVPVEGFLRDLLDLLDEHTSAGEEELLWQVLSAMACHAAVKAGQRLTAQEMQALLVRRTEVERYGSCPHGRPTTLALSLEELGKQFQRT